MANKVTPQQLQEKLELLLKRQDYFDREIRQVQADIDQLKATYFSEKSDAAVPDPIDAPEPQLQSMPIQQKALNTKSKAASKKTTNRITWEKQIGENWINKLGIVITVLGVAIGAKYSIENDLINPITRIVLGYLAGLVLLGFGIKLKDNYHNYSAVLVSGSIAVFYFITFAAFSFYAIVPQGVAFVLLVLFTVFAIIAALHYNQQSIAAIGFVGAYAVPFLLSDGSGNVAILFSYMTIINGGILALSFKKNWKAIYYAAFAFSWLMYTAWYLLDYSVEEHFGIGLLFLGLFFALFYFLFGNFALRRNNAHLTTSLGFLITNALLFYLLGVSTLSSIKSNYPVSGIFTLSNAILHGAVGWLLLKNNKLNSKLLFLLTGLTILFVAITIPILLSGSWITIMWAGLALLLVWLGKSKGILGLHLFAYPVKFLALLSLLMDWEVVYFVCCGVEIGERISPFLNPYFLTSVLFLSSFGGIWYINNSTSTRTFQPAKTKILSVTVPFVILIVSYFAIWLEINTYFYQLYLDSKIVIPSIVETDSDAYVWNENINAYKVIWLGLYTLLFGIGLTLINGFWLKGELFAKLSSLILVVSVLAFLMFGLYAFSELRNEYLFLDKDRLYPVSSYFLALRYVAILVIGFALTTCKRLVVKTFPDEGIQQALGLFIHVVILWVLTSELIHWMDIANSQQPYKLGISILWGMYALFLVAWGITKKQQYIRIGAFSLFGLTLLKLFLYDITHLSTLAKTVVFVVLGVLLLLISFLYNKFNKAITDEDIRETD
ncbi:MAG: DUF2339 domain-containing protein [Schleiferiaceae bacterium]|nr:DUF2339 domain-containing protein [Schleiferiaceae bacterium]